MKPCLITVIENSQTNLGAGASYDNGEMKATSEPLEEEAIKCFTAWRKYGGAWKDIPIYCICPSSRTPSQETIDKLGELDVTYMHVPMKEAEDFTCGYWNVPLVGAWCEDNLDEDYFIHIDLDMTLIKEPSQKLLHCDKMVLAKVGRLTEQERKDIHIIECEYHFESCFIVSWKENRFYSIWYERLMELAKEFSPEWERYADLEEFAIDLMYVEGFQIEADCYFQCGFRYPVSDIGDSELDHVHFVHRHIYEPDTEFPKLIQRKLKRK